MSPSETFEPGSKDRAGVLDALKRWNKVEQVPLVINGEERFIESNTFKQINPANLVGFGQCF